MDSDELASMYAEVVRGVAKEKSRYVTDGESGGLWDKVAADVEEMRAANPKVILEVPTQIPGDLGSTRSANGAADPADHPRDAESARTSERRPKGADTSDVTDTLLALQRGEVTIQDVEAQFRARTWPRRASQEPSTAREAFAAEQTDRDPDPAESFADVAQAFYAGVIDVATYKRLAAAAHASLVDTQPSAPNREAGSEPTKIRLGGTGGDAS